MNYAKICTVRKYLRPQYSTCLCRMDTHRHIFPYSLHITPTHSLQPTESRLSQTRSVRKGTDLYNHVRAPRLYNSIRLSASHFQPSAAHFPFSAHNFRSPIRALNDGSQCRFSIYRNCQITCHIEYPSHKPLRPCQIYIEKMSEVIIK